VFNGANCWPTVASRLYVVTGDIAMPQLKLIDANGSRFCQCKMLTS